MMLTTSSILLVAVLHVLFMVLEMFLWKKPLGRRVFGLSREQADQTAVLAANQGKAFGKAGSCQRLASHAA